MSEFPSRRIRFVLASSSPARLATLRAAGVQPEVIVSYLDESAIQADTTAELTQQLATAKAKTVAEKLRGEALVLGCDSMLQFEGEPMGKPGTIEAAVERWQRMRGKAGTLYTGHCLIDRAAERAAIVSAATNVWFADVTDEEIDIYCSSGEPSNVAGAFTIDGYGGWFIEKVEGDPHNVVGVSLPMLRRLLTRLNYTLFDIGYPGP